MTRQVSHPLLLMALSILQVSAGHQHLRYAVIRNVIPDPGVEFRFESDEPLWLRHNPATF